MVLSQNDINTYSFSLMTYLIQAMWINMLSHNDIKTYSLMTYSIQAVWINMLSHNEIKTFVMTYSIQERWLEH